MSKRFVSLYYGSIGKARAAGSVLASLGGFYPAGARRREALGAAVRGQLGDCAVFALGSARSALTACLQAARIGTGDEVLLSSYTCLAVPTAVIAAGATPVYVDIDPDTLNADAESVIAALSPRVRAVVIQHTLGVVAPIAPIIEAARRRGIVAIEDCSLAVGSRRGGRLVGTWGDAAIFSMELSKTLSCGWGGVLVVHDSALSASMQRVYADLPEPPFWSAVRDLWQTAISAWCHCPELFHRVGKYVLFLGFRVGFFRRSTPAPEFDGRIGPGFLVRLGGPQAALAARQWRDLPAIAAACEANGRRLRETLLELGIPTPGVPAAGDTWVAPRVSFLIPDRRDAYAFFFSRGIDLGEWFDGPLSPVPASPLFNYRVDRYPRAAAVAAEIANVPCHNRMTAGDVARTADVLRAYVRERPGVLSRQLH